MLFQHLRNPRSAAAVAALLFLSACASAPPGAAPSSEPLIGSVVPARLDGASGSATDEALPDTAATSWQHLIQDARLRAVVSLALAHNRDLRLAALNIDAARARYRITDAARWPTVTAGLGGLVSRGSTAAGDSGDISRQLTASLAITSWELDLWGRLGQLKDAALNRYLATEAARDGVQSALIAEVAQAWLTVQANQTLAELVQQTVDSRERSLDVTQRRYSAGALSGLDTAAAQAALETALGDRASAQTSLTQSLNALRLLVGADVPTDLLPQADATADSVALAAVPGGLSSEVLLQRPDVKADYRSVQAALAEVGAARAALLPTITLTAVTGSASQALTELFSAGSGPWSLAPSLRLPLLDGGASSANVEVAEVNRQIEFTTYERTVQTAFKEVADALAVREHLDARLQAQEKLVDAYQRSLLLTERQYQAGSVNALIVLDAQRSLYAAQQGLIGLRLTEQANRLALYKALGGA
ncbi:MAG: transporter [Candidatus Accumulibacter meliphilus]|jgi:NodT family efflux transporter outer membrane factor (OMF) lipoprotein|uniref:Transporter n=1 Tax=Candidatus Accumulibacter meliphilus TaxID=2211374 RepID=A0A369XMU4_9PROT|nr:MAG: transporter [Candidatus Accumulibacter meliphilus]